MPVAPAEDEGPDDNSTQDLAEFAAWAAEFIDYLHSTPTADKGEQ